MNFARILPRFTVRRLIIVVAIVAVGIGATLECQRLRKLSNDYSIQASRIGSQAKFFRLGERMSHEEWRAGREKVLETHRKSGYMVAYPPEAEQCRQLIPYYESLLLKYERAALYPFLPVEPNPPHPLLK
jgi:hypothetical protein